MKVLVINAGSSSLKYQLIDTVDGKVMAKGLCERIGIDGVLVHTGSKDKTTIKTPMPTMRKRFQRLSTSCSTRSRASFLP